VGGTLPAKMDSWWAVSAIYRLRLRDYTGSSVAAFR
jgi:hypothetical protein